MTTTKNDAQRLPQQLADELAALDLPSYEQRYAAIHGVLGTRGIRPRYLSKLEQLRVAHSHSDLLVQNIGREIDRACAQFLIDALPPAGSGIHAGIPRST